MVEANQHNLILGNLLSRLLDEQFGWGILEDHSNLQRSIDPKYKVTCAAIAAARWLSLEHSLSWLIFQERQLTAYCDNKWTRILPLKQWWILAKDANEHMTFTNIYFKAMQTRKKTVLERNARR